MAKNGGFTANIFILNFIPLRQKIIILYNYATLGKALCFHRSEKYKINSKGIATTAI